MKCKYCDYENPKDAIRCECCGATLATQRSIDFYRKEAKRRKKNPRREQKAKEKALQKIKRKEQRAAKKESSCGCCNEKRRRVRKKLLISLSGIALILIACTLLPLIPSVFVVHPNIDFSAYNSFFEDKSEKPVVVYFPESEEYGFLYKGKLMETRIRSEKKPELISCHETGLYLFTATEGSGTNASVILITVSHHGVRLFTVNGITADERTIFFYPSGNGEGFLLVIGDESQLVAYSNDLSSGTDLVYVGSYKPYEKNMFQFPEGAVYDTVSESYLVPYVFHNGLYMINCKTNEIFSVCDSIGTIYCRGVGIVNIDENGALSHFDTETCERFDASLVITAVLSPSGKTAVYNTVMTPDSTGTGGYDPNRRTHSYVLFNNEAVKIAENMEIISVNDSGDLIYGYQKETRAFYAVDKNGRATLLCDKDFYYYSYAPNRDSTELLFTVDSQIYLSQHGGKPTKVADGYENVFLFKGDKNYSAPISFIGGLWAVKSNGLYSVCTLTDDLTLKLLTNGDTYIPHAVLLGKDKATLMISINNSTYKYTEGKDTELTLVRIGSGRAFSTDLLGSYVDDTSAIFYTDASGIKTITTNNVLQAHTLNGILLVLMKKDNGSSPAVLPSDTTAETETSAEDESGRRKPVNEYSLYYSLNGGDLLCAMKNVHHFTVEGNTLYVFVMREYLSDGTPIYDVYAGEKPRELTLIAEKIIC